MTIASVLSALLQRVDLPILRNPIDAAPGRHGADAIAAARR